MRNLSALLAFVVLSLGMVACQTDPITARSSHAVPEGAPQVLPTNLPSVSLDDFSRKENLNVSSTRAKSLKSLNQKRSLAPQQSGVYCYYPSTLGDLEGCVGYDYDNSAWYYAWPWGYGYVDCYVWVWDGSAWTDYIYFEDDYVLCNG